MRAENKASVDLTLGGAYDFREGKEYLPWLVNPRFPRPPAIVDWD
jgi:hypothetical protein